MFFIFVCLRRPTFETTKSRQKSSAQAPLGLAQRKMPLWLAQAFVASEGEVVFVGLVAIGVVRCAWWFVLGFSFF